MQIGLGHVPRQNSGRRPPPGAPPASEVGPLDTLELTKALSASLAYKFHKLKAKVIRSLSGGLSDQPKVQMERPLVCVQGFRSKPGGFQPLLEHLTQEQSNGGQAYYVKCGKIYLEPECETPLPENQTNPEALVFRVMPHERMQSFDVTADQLKIEMAAIKKFTGREKVDVLAHSMGGLSVRRYLDKHDDQLGKLMMLGTPQRGTRNAAFARKVLAHDMGWAMAIGGISQIAAPAVEIMRSLDEGPEANLFLKEMNDRLPEQLAKVEDALTVGADSFNTPEFGADSDWGPGDALVERSTLELEGLETVVLPGGGTKVHHTLPTDDDVFQEMIGFFEWTEA